MIRFNVKGSVPRRIAQERAHIVTSRTTLFGIHVPTGGNHCSKTAIVSFLGIREANMFVERLKEHQDNKGVVDRTLIDDAISCVTPETPGGSLMPLKLDTLSVHELESLCVIHYFDMYVAHAADIQENVLELYCYKHITPDYPDREVLNRFMEEMLRKDDPRSN